MKYISYKTMIPTILIIFGVIRTVSIIQSKGSEEEINQTEVIDSTYKKVLKRHSITFILGEDKEQDNPFYAEATNYYLFNEEGKTEEVITHCRSISEVQHYLTENIPGNNMPWGLINLVSHGNQWLGLSVKVTPYSKRASLDRINEYLEADSLLKMNESVIDNKTEIFVHACGIGHNQEILKSIAQVFSSEKYTPVVKASKLFEFYISEKDNGIVRESQRYYADAKYITYKMGYRPENQVLVNLLNEKYSNSDIDFEDAVNKNEPRFVGDSYHYTFEVPVKWVIKYEDSASYPDLSTKDLKNNWISEQPEIVELLKKIDIPADKFNWWFRDVYVNNDDGSKSPAVWLKGYCTILCVIKPLTEDSLSNRKLRKPFEPNIYDCSYYTVINESPIINEV